LPVNEVAVLFGIENVVLVLEVHVTHESLHDKGHVAEAKADEAREVDPTVALVVKFVTFVDAKPCLDG
jgi:hypothetical protein